MKRPTLRSDVILAQIWQAALPADFIGEET